MDLFDRLKAANPAAWAAYVRHDFVRRLGDGSLPIAAFRAYLVQDYLFLIQFARAWALAAYKSRTLADIRAASAGLAAILEETNLHVGLCGRWGLSPAALEQTPEHRTSIAYTRFVLDSGAAGDLLDLHVALAPCVIGYAEIGRRLGETAVPGDHPYRQWIEEYAGAAFQGAAAAARQHLDVLAQRALPGRGDNSRFTELAQLFGTATRLESDFWQIGLDAATDAASGTPDARSSGPEPL